MLIDYIPLCSTGNDRKKYPPQRRRDCYCNRVFMAHSPVALIICEHSLSGEEKCRHTKPGVLLKNLTST